MHVQTQQPSVNQQKHWKPVKNFATALTLATPNKKNIKLFNTSQSIHILQSLLRTSLQSVFSAGVLSTSPTGTLPNR